MDKQLTKADVLNSKNAYLYNEDSIFVECKDEVYGFNEKNLEWYIKSNFYDYFESSLMLSYIKSITKEEALQKVEECYKSIGAEWI